MGSELINNKSVRNLRPNTTIENLSIIRKLFIAYFNSEGTKDEYLRCLEEYLAFLRMHFRLSEIKATSDHVNAFKNYLHSEILNSEITVNKKLSIVSSYYTFLIRRKIVPDNPVRFIRKYKVSSSGKSRAITREEIEIIYRSLKEESKYQLTIKTLVILLFETGIRVSEAINLTTENIVYDYGNYYLEFVQKGGKVHKVKLNELSKYYIGKLLDCEASKSELIHLLFKTKNGAKFDRKNIHRLIASLGKKNNLKVKIHPHSARVSFMREALESGMELYSIKKAVGHSSIKTTERYLA